MDAVGGEAVDVDEVVRLLRANGVHPPMLLRFPDIVSHRLRKLQVRLCARASGGERASSTCMDM